MSARRCTIAAVIALASRSTMAQVTPPVAVAANDSIPAHESFTIQSRGLAEPRPINVHTPAAYATSPTARFPVLYMPDGGMNEDFPHVGRTVDSLIALGAIRPVIVVGVPNTQRRRDLTGPTRVASDSAIAPRVGESAAFRRFLRDELVPVIEARYRTTSERAIIGESLAGLFIVETFLLEPSLFDQYIALDPSLWWNRGALLDSAASRLATFGSTRRTIYLSSSDVAEIADGTKRLAGMLASLKNANVMWSYEPRSDLTHATIFRGVEPTALVKVLGAPKR
jgi:predicted alpha/beta superfamily hydrolase